MSRDQITFGTEACRLSGALTSQKVPKNVSKIVVVYMLLKNFLPSSLVKKASYHYNPAHSAVRPAQAPSVVQAAPLLLPTQHPC